MTIDHELKTRLDAIDTMLQRIMNEVREAKQAAQQAEAAARRR
jgi:hypothetical protein